MLTNILVKQKKVGEWVFMGKPIFHCNDIFHIEPQHFNDPLYMDLKVGDTILLQSDREYATVVDKIEPTLLILKVKDNGNI